MVNKYNFTDGYWLELFHVKNEQAFEDFYTQYYDKLFRHATRLVPTAEDAEEIVNTTFFLAFKNLNKFYGRSTLVTWLYKILHNQIFDLYRRNRIRNNFVNQYPDELTDIADWNKSPETAFNRKEIKGCVIMSINKLPKSMRKTAELYIIKGLPINVIAQQLNCPSGTIRSRTYRIRQHIKKFLNELR